MVFAENFCSAASWCFWLFILLKVWNKSEFKFNCVLHSISLHENWSFFLLLLNPKFPLNSTKTDDLTADVYKLRIIHILLRQQCVISLKSYHHNLHYIKPPHTWQQEVLFTVEIKSFFCYTRSLMQQKSCLLFVS